MKGGGHVVEILRFSNENVSMYLGKFIRGGFGGWIVQIVRFLTKMSQCKGHFIISGL